MEIYRGKKESFPLGWNYNVFLDSPRQPRDTAFETHRIADAWFLKTFGIAARSQSLMCSTDDKQAAKYGQNVRIIRPVPPYKLISSTQVYDFYEIMSQGFGADTAAIETWLETKDFYCVDHTSGLSDDVLGEVMVCCEFYDVLAAPGYPFAE